MKILIAGDTSDWNINSFSPRSISPEYSSKIINSDLCIFNLEGPIRLRNKQYSKQLHTNIIKEHLLQGVVKFLGKTQPVVYSTKNIAKLFLLNKNSVITLANNHIKDLGLEGFKDTLNLLKKNQIKYIGAGYNLKEANKILNINDLAIINTNWIAASKWGLPVRLYNASKYSYGASYYSYNELKDIVTRKRRLDKLVILIIHAGKELAVSPSQLDLNLNKIKKLRADITVVHHPHIYLKTNFEKNNIFILGDFIFRYDSHLPPNRGSAMLEIDLHPNSKKIESQVIKFDQKSMFNQDNNAKNCCEK